jgi:hypothetical protein
MQMQMQYRALGCAGTAVYGPISTNAKIWQVAQDDLLAIIRAGDEWRLLTITVRTVWIALGTIVIIGAELTIIYGILLWIDAAEEWDSYDS